MKLHLRDLTLRQGEFTLQLDLELHGQVIAIFGPSGSGKTSLLELIAGLRRPASGAITLDDLPLVDTSARLFLPPERRGIGYVPQDLALFPHLSVRQNLVYGHKPSAPHPALTLAHVAAVLEIDTLLDRSIAQVSGGQKQRVAFARALLALPRLLLMDEPLASLDHDLKLKIIPYLQRLRDEFKIPILYVSHSPDEISALADHLILLRDGRCLRSAPPADLFQPTASLTLKPGLLDGDSL